MTQKQHYTDVLILIAILEPSLRNTLYIISKNGYAFSPQFTIDIIEKGLIKPVSQNRKSNLGEYLKLVAELTERDYIKINKKLQTQITIKGQIYRVFTHPYVPVVGIIIGAIVGLGILKFNCNSPENSKESGTKEQILQATCDSPHYQKGYDSVYSYN